MFDWADYLALAREMVNTGEPSGAPAESRLRCAVSRAYYAALGRAAAYLTYEVGEVLPPETFHETVIRSFTDSEQPGWEAVGAKLDRLRDYRKGADYESEIKNWSAKAEESLKLSSKAISSLENLFGGPPQFH